MKTILSVAFLAALSACAPRGLVDIGHKDSPPSLKSPEEIAYEQALRAANALGPNHKILEELVGAWDLDISLWSDPSNPPQKHTGYEVVEPIFAGRFVRSKSTLQINHQTHISETTLGFDNFREAFLSFSIESDSNQIIHSRGTLRPDGKNLDFMAVTTDAVSRIQYRIVSQISLINKNKRTLTVWEIFPTGEKVKTMFIVYNRT